MGAVHVHEFMSLDGVIDAPTWTFDYGFDPKMGEAIGAVTAKDADDARRHGDAEARRTRLRMHQHHNARVDLFISRR